MAKKSTKTKKIETSTKKKGFFSSLYDKLDRKMEESSKKSCGCGSKCSDDEDEGCCK